MQGSSFPGSPRYPGPPPRRVLVFLGGPLLCALTSGMVADPRRSGNRFPQRLGPMPLDPGTPLSLIPDMGPVPHGWQPEVTCGCPMPHQLPLPMPLSALLGAP